MGHLYVTVWFSGAECCMF